MKLVSPSSPKKRDPKAVLLLGPPGGGKSTLMLQFPKIGVEDIDQNLDGPIDFLQRKRPVEFGIEVPLLDPNGRVLPAKVVWPNIQNRCEDLCREKDLLWIGVDGLTGLNFHIINHVKGDKLEMTQDMWIPFRQHLLKFINTVRAAGKHYIMTCHEEIDIDRDGTVKRRKVSVDSKIKDYFGGWFTDVWRCEARPGPRGTTEFKITTAPTTADDLKRSNPDMPAEIILNPNDPKYDFHQLVYRYLEPPVTTPATA